MNDDDDVDGAFFGIAMNAQNDQINEVCDELITSQAIIYEKMLDPAFTGGEAPEVFAASQRGMNVICGIPWQAIPTVMMGLAGKVVEGRREFAIVLDGLFRQIEVLDGWMRHQANTNTIDPQALAYIADVVMNLRMLHDLAPMSRQRGEDE